MLNMSALRLLDTAVRRDLRRSRKQPLQEQGELVQMRQLTVDARRVLAEDLAVGFRVRYLGGPCASERHRHDAPSLLA